MKKQNLAPSISASENAHARNHKHGLPGAVMVLAALFACLTVPIPAMTQQHATASQKPQPRSDDHADR